MSWKVRKKVTVSTSNSCRSECEGDRGGKNQIVCFSNVMKQSSLCHPSTEYGHDLSIFVLRHARHFSITQIYRLGRKVEPSGGFRMI